MTPLQKISNQTFPSNIDNNNTNYKSQIFSNKKLCEWLQKEERSVSPNSLKKLNTITEEASEIKEEISKKISTLNFMSIMNSNKYKV